jgi:hypothetical protein
MNTETQPRTHDYTTRRWGHDYTFDPIKGGQRGTALGWGRGLRDGDYLLLQNGAGSTRYRIERVSYFADPADMWKAELAFDPRAS